MREMITANRLADGVVVFLDAESGWSEDFHRGAIFEDAASKAQGNRGRDASGAGERRRRSLSH